MLIQFSILLCLLLITAIFFQMPKESMGLTNFVSTNSTNLGPPTSGEKIIKILTIIAVCTYVCLAFELDSQI